MKCLSGEGGILYGQLPQVLAQSADVTQSKKPLEFAPLWLVADTCRRLAPLGVDLSTNSAQSGATEIAPAGQYGATTRPPRKLSKVKGGRKQHQFSSAGTAAASYSRYSSKNQEEKSIDDQIRESREDSKKYDATMLADCEFADSAISGTKRVRRGLDAMLTAAKEGKFQSLFFHKLSRLARDLLLTMSTMRLLVHKYHVRVICFADGIDSNQSNWELHCYMLGIFNEQYIKDLAANVHRGQVGTVLSEFSVGDYRFGYTSIPSPGGEVIGRGRNQKPRMVYRVDEDQAMWVQQIFY